MTRRSHPLRLLLLLTLLASCQNPFSASSGRVAGVRVVLTLSDPSLSASAARLLLPTALTVQVTARNSDGTTADRKTASVASSGAVATLAVAPYKTYVLSAQALDAAGRVIFEGTSAPVTPSVDQALTLNLLPVLYNAGGVLQPWATVSAAAQPSAAGVTTGLSSLGAASSQTFLLDFGSTGTEFLFAAPPAGTDLYLQDAQGNALSMPVSRLLPLPSPKAVLTVTYYNTGSSVSPPVSSLGRFTIPAQSLTVTPTGATTFAAGTSLALTATPTPANANTSIAWTSLNPSVATVSAGVVQGVSSGTTQILVTDTTSLASQSLTVNVTVAVTAITVAASGSTTLDSGGSVTLTATASPAGVTDASVTWSTTDPTGSIAALSANGSTAGVTAGAGSGTVTITATSVSNPTVSRSTTVTVHHSVTSVAVTPSPAGQSLSLGTGGSVQLAATVLPTNATNSAVSWTSSAPSVASVDAVTGLVTAGGGSGSAVITATAQDGTGLTGTATVAVAHVVTGLALTPSTAFAMTTTSPPVTITAAPTNGNATNPTVAWTSSNPAIATVSASGVVTVGTSTGIATITATAQDGSGVFASINVSVTHPVTAITLAPTGSLSVAAGGALALSATVAPTFASNSTLAWTWSADAVHPGAVTVSAAGVVTGVTPGIVVVTAAATDGSGMSASTLITVTGTVGMTFSMTGYQALGFGAVAATVSAGQSLPLTTTNTSLASTGTNWRLEVDGVPVWSGAYSGLAVPANLAVGLHTITVFVTYLDPASGQSTDYSGSFSLTVVQ